MKKFLLSMVLTTLIVSLQAQGFSREAGVRGGLTSGFTYRVFLDDYLSYESILSFRQSGMQLTLLRQIHEHGSMVELGNNFHVLYGFGGHLGFFFTDKYRPFGINELYYPQKKFSPVFGADANVAVEYRMDSYPLVFGLDYKPFFEFSFHEFFKIRLWDLAFTIKYRF
jgi:hypothetical protein